MEVGLIKDWLYQNEGYVFRVKVRHFLDPREWLRLHKWRAQRANRGWSDYDAWGAGEHIAKMTAEMLQHLQDKSYCDWPEWFKLNVQEEDGYKSLQEVIDDINAFLEYEKTQWTDGLTHEGSIGEGGKWVSEKTGKVQNKAQITRRVKKWHEEEMRLYDNAKKAMSFFSRHFAAFWD